MRKWTRAVVVVVSSLVLAACGGMENVEAPSVEEREGPSATFYVCGDYSCDPGETTSCPEDCPGGGGCLAGGPSAAFYVCGDSSCDPGEPTSCPEDCPGGGGWCGDGWCGPGEGSYNCPGDCGGGGGGWCGNGVCGAGENQYNCPADCC